jgi:hypothetical protein
MQVNLATPATGLTFTDNSVSTGQWCYIVQSEINTQTPVAMSSPSNVAGPINVPAGYIVNLSWTAPITGSTPTGYVISRAAAVQANLAAPNSATALPVAN